MVKNAEDLIEISRENAFGGLGSLYIVDYLSEKECKGKLNFLRRLRLEPGSSLGEHSHTSNFEIYFILKGEGLLIDDGIEKKVGVGDMIYTADGASHSLINQGVEDLEFLAFIIPE
ncbi:cupin [Fusobacterium necrophorum subsp. funduliforme]|uniref:Cupin n=4 Tax=Fusobacterium necrophorum TaxID=859 RepID=A0A170MVX8_9FUSO|nr:cupin domain-containing protein [Fusobacterium necrophorum]EHO20854.1 hypothetical protein HMPREF9466_00881 [Fusobacterium necrophorum subsp. funduliforme 1_1_36S]AVQ20570.1 cupin domain-containing protein [Fusobacterium necrophorum subsp. funduliforme]AYV92304.1 cupin domain-containing protein [Fusobacterium necrophorum subsp. funduliforme]EIJ72105.1 cupin domain protein [Fusobacterium necrophorum subsp. funduliforme ATCC 51357]EYD69482.1 hypothetical protein FNF_04336 [Fusobacterium necro